MIRKPKLNLKKLQKHTTCSATRKKRARYDQFGPEGVNGAGGFGGGGMNMDDIFSMFGDIFGGHGGFGGFGGGGRTRKAPNIEEGNLRPQSKNDAPGNIHRSNPKNSRSKRKWPALIATEAEPRVAARPRHARHAMVTALS